MTRRKDVNWNNPIDTWEQVQVAVLMDLRDELKALNALNQRFVGILECPNFIAIPRKLDRISRNTAKPKRKKA